MFRFLAFIMDSCAYVLLIYRIKLEITLLVVLNNFPRVGREEAITHCHWKYWEKFNKQILWLTSTSLLFNIYITTCTCKIENGLLWMQWPRYWQEHQCLRNDLLNDLVISQHSQDLWHRANETSACNPTITKWEILARVRTRTIHRLH